MPKRSMMGFKPVEVVPPKSIEPGRSIYDHVIDKVVEDGGIYGNDTKDLARAKSLVVTLTKRIKSRACEDKVSVMRRYTTVYLVAK
jgi:hypothetical protein